MENKQINSDYTEICDHSTMVMEFAFGGPTGNFICLDCEHLLSSSIVIAKQDELLKRASRLPQEYSSVA
jgi:hypothetical protein